ncbi:cyclin-B2-1-like [Miscanthus floridulus]|uniref:cyclin-B2-1-like n=1 Tax=Miscanthus floridulus TaxID=154761 RepID=UPI0034581316
MTRKYVASLGSKGQPECLPIITDLEPGVDQKESIGDGTVDVDVELYEPVDDSDSDIDMGETENEDIMNQDELLMDIDSADSGNPLAATRIC